MKSWASPVILTTHNLDDIEKLCKRVIFIDQGRVIYDGSTSEMVTEFGEHRYLVVDTGGWKPGELEWQRAGDGQGRRAKAVVPNRRRRPYRTHDWHAE